jgi:H+/Cl- antiporter ClcA
MGNARTEFPLVPELTLDFVTVLKVALLAVVSGLVALLFCKLISLAEKNISKKLKNPYVRSFVISVLILGITLILNTRMYNGAGMDIIGDFLSGDNQKILGMMTGITLFAFLIKMLMTVLSISAGFKGGEIVPAFFVGSTFGCVVAPLLGLDPSFAAAIGFVALFCGVVNCPVASIILSIEIFGADGLIFFAIACAVSYLMSGSFGLYKKQKILYSKFDDVYIDEYTK